jgi:hypothetical protein
MIEIINQCYICKEWFEEKVLKVIRIPDQSGYVEKPVCPGCLDEIKTRSEGIPKKTPGGLLLDRKDG